MIEFFNQLINDFVDQKQQKLKKGSTNLSINQNDLNTQLVKYQEGDEYGMLTKRWRTQTVFENFLENLNSQSITCKLQYTKHYSVSDTEQFLDISALTQDELQIYNVVEQIIKQQMIKIIWNQLGAFFESWDEELDSKFNAILKDINNTNKLILKNQLSLLLEEYKNINQINTQIQVNIETNYKFDIQYEEQKAQHIFLQELKVQVSNYSFNDFQTFVNTIKSNVKVRINKLLQSNCNVRDFKINS
ncbi:unnamed protein product (macronuclear) [Paramecium tetraurelia]|uniref:Uncharacterized protein n=1 Tax=Paramecium tetraurelia TaxID=5888 RepID=A0C4W3_PARTE|nr:uncharacterized protein GSPATT00006329001 [Paramecium tetraurelia]CAK65830.1 unnamed protein product [Paramecium tetraurelia]|eukprot:XP_001433227.1 hypothetical protein (macronuclear) [Paramecium tetraurelia strain d4-2]